jgi:hypothetical protein
MDVHNRRIYLRSAVLLVVFLLHGSLIRVFLREKSASRDHQHRLRPDAAISILDTTGTARDQARCA